MRTEFHRSLTREALIPFFTEEAVETAIRANDRQDGLRGQIGHPEYHIDNSVPLGYAYMLSQKQAALIAFQNLDCETGMQYLGRCLHAIQDFYSHSNYVKLWLMDNGGLGAEPSQTMPLLDWSVHPELRTGRVTLQEGLTYLPWVGRLFARLLTLPADSHFALNLDGPHRGHEFAFALEAARKHSQHVAREVWEIIVAQPNTRSLRCVQQSQMTAP